MEEEPLDAILWSTRWQRIIMVRGVPALGRVCDPRCNDEIAKRPHNDVRWRNTDDRWSIVVWKSDARPGASPLHALYGSDRLTLVYNYEGVASRIAMAQLLLEAYDVKLQGWRTLPPVWWHDLDAYEHQAIAALNRIEFHFAQPQLAAAAVTTASIVIPEGFDPQTQVTVEPVALAAFCCGDICLSTATRRCTACRQSLCQSCWEREHEGCVN